MADLLRLAAALAICTKSHHIKNKEIATWESLKNSKRKRK